MEVITLKRSMLAMCPAPSLPYTEIRYARPNIPPFTRTTIALITASQRNATPSRLTLTVVITFQKKIVP